MWTLILASWLVSRARAMADAPPTLAAALKNVQDATTFINNLPFTRSNRLSAAALASEAQFEQLYLRDAEDHEIALFRSEPNENRYDPVDQATMDPRLDSRWTATKRIGPRRVGVLDKASPLKERNPDRTDDPARCLRAARKLLDVQWVLAPSRASPRLITLPARFPARKPP